VYDVIVVGGQLAGGFTTALLARRGLQVLHVPHDGLCAPYAKGEFLLPHAPLLLAPPKSIPVFDELASELGLTTQLSRQTAQPALQLIRPGNWFELRRDEKERAVELKRALRTGADAFELDLAKGAQGATAGDAFFAAKLDFPPEGWFGRWKFGRQLKRFEGMEQRLVMPAESAASPLRALLPYLSSLESPAPLTESRVFGRMLVPGVSTFPGGREGLHALLLDRARELGADVLAPDEQVECFSFDGSSTAGVRLSRTETVYRAPLIVGAADLEVLTGLVPEGKRAAAKKTLPLVTASKAIFTLNVVVPEWALPRGMASLCLIAPDGAQAVLAQIAASRGPAIEGEKSELRLLSLSTVAPLSVKQGHEPAIGAFIDQLWASLEFVLPFTRRHAKLESTPWLDALGVVDGRGEPAPLFTTSGLSYFGLTGHTTAAPWKRMLLANRQVYPGLGLEGEVLAATRAVNRIERLLKKNDPLKTRKSA
jgi:phytoene dehydrogenase-like protein